MFEPGDEETEDVFGNPVDPDAPTWAQLDTEQRAAQRTPSPQVLALVEAVDAVLALQAVEQPALQALTDTSVLMGPSRRLLPRTRPATHPTPPHPVRRLRQDQPE